MNWVEQEEQRLSENLAAGLISHHEYNRAMQELHREAREAWAEERDEAHRRVDRDYDNGW